MEIKPRFNEHLYVLCIKNDILEPFIVKCMEKSLDTMKPCQIFQSLAFWHLLKLWFYCLNSVFIGHSGNLISQRQTSCLHIYSFISAFWFLPEKDKKHVLIWLEYISVRSHAHLIGRGRSNLSRKVGWGRRFFGILFMPLEQIGKFLIHCHLLQEDYF